MYSKERKNLDGANVMMEPSIVLKGFALALVHVSTEVELSNRMLSAMATCFQTFLFSTCAISFVRLCLKHLFLICQVSDFRAVSIQPSTWTVLPGIL